MITRTFAVLVGLAAAASPAFAAGVTSVQAPKRVKAGGTATIVVSVDAVASCRLTAGRASAVAPAAGADRVTFAFTVSRRVRPGRYAVSLRCGTAKAQRLRVMVT